MASARRHSRTLARCCALAALTAGCEVGLSAGTAPLAPEAPVVDTPVPRGRVATPYVVNDFAANERALVGTRVYVEDLVAGAAHACVRSYAGTVHCWGANDEGQLGRPSADFDPTPGLAGHGVLVQRVFAGPTQTALIDDAGQLGHWGLYAPRNDDGVTPWSKHDTPGVDALEGVAFGERFALAWDGNGHVIGWGDPDRVSFTTAFIIKPVLIHLGFDVMQAAVWSRDGDGHGCLVVRGGTVACWGRNDHGQLGRGSMGPGIFEVPHVDHVTRVVVGERFSCALRDDAGLWCWGANDAGQLGNRASSDSGAPVRVALPGPVLAVTTGARHACAVTRDGSVWCWGSNSHGQLGTSSVELLSATPVRVPGLPKATGVAAGDTFSCAHTEDARAFCWGNNDRGQLGDGGTVRRADPRPVAL